MPTTLMDRRHLETLELPKVLDRLASYSAFSAGAEKARSLTPTPIVPEALERLHVTTEARALLTARPQTTLGGARDVRSQVEAAQRGATLLPTDLLDIQGTLQSGRSLQNTLTRLNHQFPHLADVAGRIAPCPDLIDGINRCLDERGQVLDDASSELAKIRRELGVTHDRLLEKLQKIISSPKNATYLQEGIVTQREGRYVIPLKADFKGRIRGVVHDRSASGATLFIEPMAVIELGNAWRELQVQEEQEVHRILAALSAQVAARGAEIKHTVDALADLDLAFAKAQYADDLEATAPALVAFTEQNPESTSPGATVRLLQARHPLLDPETVVPIDMEMDNETHILVITGPNTGGKTVTLKTVGLLTAMAQAGLHIPVSPGSALSPFEAIYADIGDEQSIEQSLSTFSSHLTNILSFIHHTTRTSLVLLDELGAGTDPAEGSALARAMLDKLRSQGATTLVATHYPELKAYAQLTPGVKNACVEFNSETLRPTYRLSIGLPGRSNAFAIATRLGLDEEIVRQAEGLITREDRQTEDLLADIHRLRLQAVKERDNAYAARAEAERISEELRQRMLRIEDERADILQATREEAVIEIEVVREEARGLRQRLQSAATAQDELEAVEEELETLEEGLPEEPEPSLPPPAHPLSRPIRIGDTVWVTPLQAEGEVLSVEKQEAEVQVGPARTRVTLSQLELRSAPEPEPEGLGATYHTPSPDTQIELRGHRADDALELLDRHLDAASLAGLQWVNIIHGKGTGALRKAVRGFLRNHPLVQSYRTGDEGEGGDGLTVATLVSS